MGHDGRDSTGVAPSPQQMTATRPKATAVEFGISMLAARSWPEKKLRQKIGSRYSREETDAGMVRLSELRLVDDDSWAERYARDRFERLGKGRLRIRMELLGKGIAAATADAALDRVVGGDDERVRAAETLEAMRVRLCRGPGAAQCGLSGPIGAKAQISTEPALETGADVEINTPDPDPTVDSRERRAQAEKLKTRLFRRMLARGYPAGIVRDLLDVS